MGRKSKQPAADAVTSLFSADNPFRRKPQTAAAVAAAPPAAEPHLGLEAAKKKKRERREASPSSSPDPDHNDTPPKKKRGREVEVPNPNPNPSPGVGDDGEGSHKKRKKRKRDELEEQYERKKYGELTGKASEPAAPLVGTKRKAQASSPQTAAMKDSFDDESKLLRTVFIGNLPLKMKGKALMKEFARFGEIESVRIRSVPVIDSKMPRKGAVIKGKINDAVDSMHAMSASTSTSIPTAKKLSLTLLIDKDRNRVVLAESAKDVVDVLFSFLTLPLGTIVRLLSKRSSLGCLDKLYESVESLAGHCFQTPACKAMLLCPRNASGVQCGRLTIRPDDHEHRIYYRCATRLRTCMVSAVPGVGCSCGRVADVPFAIPDLDGGGVDGVFVEGETGFMITDDLEVKPVSMSASLSLFNKLGIADVSVLEKKTVEFGRAQILSLLKRSLVSMTPLTDVFLEELGIVADAEKSVIRETSHAREKQQIATPESKRIIVKLFMSKDSDKVVYAEAGECFIDLLFSFLTFPLGSIVNILEKRSSIGCIDNLYKSVEILGSGNSYIKSEDHKNMLLEPKLAPYFGCSNQLLRIKVDEKFSEVTFQGAQTLNTSEMNPKLKNSELYGGSFVKGMVAFMVTDEMVVTPLSPISGVSIINQLKVPISSLEEVNAIIGESEAINLLRACLISPTALSDIFSPVLVTLLEQRWFGKLPGN